MFLKILIGFVLISFVREKSVSDDGQKSSRAHGIIFILWFLPFTVRFKEQSSFSLNCLNASPTPSPNDSHFLPSCWKFYNSFILLWSSYDRRTTSVTQLLQGRWLRHSIQLFILNLLFAFLRSSCSSLSFLSDVYYFCLHFLKGDIYNPSRFFFR